MAENVGDFLRRSFWIISDQFIPEEIVNWESLVIKQLD